MKGMVRTVTDREEENMYQAIWVIVDRGNGEEVIASAAAAGSRGGTIIYGRGSGIHETGKIFNFPIEPEKEIVLILAEIDQVDAIADRIYNDLKIGEPGNGIIFIQDTVRTYGIFKGKDK